MGAKFYDWMQRLTLPKTNLLFSDHNKGVCQLILVPVKQFFNRVNLSGRAFILQPKKVITIQFSVYALSRISSSDIPRACS